MPEALDFDKEKIERLANFHNRVIDLKRQEVRLGKTAHFKDLTEADIVQLNEDDMLMGEKFFTYLEDLRKWRDNPKENILPGPPFSQEEFNEYTKKLPNNISKLWRAFLGNKLVVAWNIKELQEMGLSTFEKMIDKVLD